MHKVLRGSGFDPWHGSGGGALSIHSLHILTVSDCILIKKETGSEGLSKISKIVDHMA